MYTTYWYSVIVRGRLHLYKKDTEEYRTDNQQLTFCNNH